HMNGRIYDPLLGRFLSADLVVQTPGDLQSYNRYSYVRNNPLRYTDPTGFQAQNVDDAKKELERARKREAERRTRGAAIDRHGVAGVLLENNAIINAGESAATTTNSAASTAQPARTPKTEKTDAT